MSLRALEKSRGEKIWWVMLALILMVAGILYFWKFDHFQFGTYQDDASYLVLAQSISEGESYGLTNPPEETLPTRYPFGWPLLIAMAKATNLSDIITLAKSLSLLFTILNVIIIGTGWHWLFFTSSWMGIAIAALYALSPLAVAQTGMAMSEPAYLFFVLAVLLLIGYKKRSGSPATIWAAVLGVMLVLAAYTRTIGFALLVAAMADLIRSRYWRWLLLSIASAVTCLFVIVMFSSIPINPLSNSSEYLDQLDNPGSYGQGQIADEYSQRFIQSVSAYATTIVRNSLVPFFDGQSTVDILGTFGLDFLPLVASLIISGTLVLGFVHNIHAEKVQAVHFYVLLYLAITLLWPFRGVRFLYGMLPFMYFYLLIGAQFIIERVAATSPRFQNRLITVALLAMLAVLLVGLNLARSTLIDDAVYHVRDLSVGTE
jgi:hypothetical protein